ncbi:Utp14 protein-domain-containing protein [Sparassis latifolia]
MARSQKQGKMNKLRTSSRKAMNASGYAKRQQSLKSKTPSGGRRDISDVYDYQPEKVRRSKVGLQVGRDEWAGFTGGDGTEDEEETGGPSGGRRPRLVGENDNDSGIGSEDDEEIDSDEAFEESDEERFAGFDFSHKNKGKSKSKPKKKQPAKRAVRFAEVDLNEDTDQDEEEEGLEDGDGSVSEDGEEEEEGYPDEFIDVLDILDGRGEPESGNNMGEKEKEGAESRKNKKPEKPILNVQGVDEGNDDEDEEMDAGDGEGESQFQASEEEDDDHRISASEGEDEDLSALQNLEDFVSSLDVGQKRKAPDDAEGTEGRGDDTIRARKKRILKERTEAGEENEFAAHLGGEKLKLDDLLAPLTAQSSNLLSLRKSAKILTSQSGSNKTLSAPLPQRTAERLDREAAYEQTKEEVDKWKATMQRIRDAEHLSFPLQAHPAGKTSNLELAAKFKPTTELESAVDKLLKSAKMREEDIAQTEALKMNHLSVEEVATRRAELAKMRDLMFRAEAKAKRVAKIKSKTYRRIKKKERIRLAAKLGELNQEDPESDETRFKRELDRARERATLRHKNTGKWAKAMKTRGELDEDQRREISEMLDRGEKLRRKIRGERDSGDESTEGGESEDEDEEATIQRIKASAFEELNRLDAQEDADVKSGKKGKSLFDMKFMKDATARNQKRVDEDVDDFIREMGGAVLDEDAEGAELVDQEQSHGATVERVGGRVTYRPGVGSSSLRPVGSIPSDTSSVTLKSSDFLDPHSDSPPLDSPVARHSYPPSAIAETNPWLVPQTNISGPMQKKHEVAVSKNSAAAEKSRNKLRKSAKKQEEEKELAKDDATVEISMTEVITLASSSKALGSSSPESHSNTISAAKPSTLSGAEDEDSEVNSELEEQERNLDRKGKGKGKVKANRVQAFAQRDLVALAFAGDRVVQDFAEQKRREIQEDAPHEVDTTLPGWGSWGGVGTKKAPPKPHLIKKVPGVDPSSRADHNKAHVIISQKRDKKAAKYLVKDLPYPYTSKAQFERSVETPLGTEWNTRVAFQRATLPRVVKKPGMIISPLEKLL